MAAFGLCLRLLACFFAVKTWLVIVLVFVILITVEILDRPKLPPSVPRVGHAPGLIGTVRNYFSLCFHYMYWLQRGYEEVCM